MTPAVSLGNILSMLQDDEDDFDPELEPMTDRQAAWLNDMGITPDELSGVKTYAEASKLIDSHNPAFKEFKARKGSKPTTGKQKAIADQHGFTIPEGETASCTST
jgi:hypothetical protein